MRIATPFICLITLTSSAFAQTTQDGQKVMVGPWEITTTYRGEKFEHCEMKRVENGLAVTFQRSEDGLQLLLDSQKWKLDRGKIYAIRLKAGPSNIEAKAIAESKGVTIDLVDKQFNARLKSADSFEVRGEGTTLFIPLSGSMAALDRLEICFDKNLRASPESNPFVAPSRKP